EVRQALRRSAARRERRLTIAERIKEVASDALYAARGMRREPIFAGFAVVTLARGIGANAAMFGVIDRLLLRGPAYVVEPDRVVHLFWTSRQANGFMSTNAHGFDRPVYPNLRAETHAFSDLAVYNQVSPALFGEGASARLVPRSTVT